MNREKLIELIRDGRDCPNEMDMFDSCCECKYVRVVDCDIERLADYLIAHGVTFAENTTVESKWIPVSERLPDIESTHKIQRGDKYTKSIRVLCACEQKGGKRMVKEGYCEIWNGNISDPCWKIPGTVDFVTHWRPLPEAPKEGE